MQTYLALFKRDAQLQPGNVPMPVFFILILVLLLLFTNTVVTGILLLFLCLFCSTQMVNDLKLAHSHELAFVLPNFKAIQFNYSLGLCSIMAITAGILLSNNFFDAMFWSILALFVISLIFLLVNHKTVLWILGFITSVVLFTTVLTLLDNTILIKQVTRFVFRVFSTLSDIKMWVVVLILGFLSIYNLYNSRRRYLSYRQYQLADLPGSWRQTQVAEKLEKNIFTCLLLPRGFYQRVLQFKETVDNWLHYGNNPSLLTKVSSNKAKSSHSFVGPMSLIFFMLPLVIFLSLIDAKIEVFRFVFFIVGLMSINLIILAIIKGFLAQQNALARVWLLNPAESRQAYTKEILTIFAKRYFRAMGLAIFMLASSAAIFFDLATFNIMIQQILFCAVVTGSISAVVTLVIVIKWPSASWTSKVLTGLSYGSYFAIFIFINLFELTHLAQVVLLVICLLLILSLGLSVRYWQNNALQ